MKRSENRILVSHAGNLPRPATLDELTAGGQSTAGALTGEYRNRLPEAVRWIVSRQAELGVDVVNDGEYSKAGSYSGYLHDRITGFSRVSADSALPPKRGTAGERDRRQFPGVYASGLWFAGSGGPIRPGFASPQIPSAPRQQLVCTASISYTGDQEVQADIDNLSNAVQGLDVEAYIAALGPLSLGAGLRNEFYASEEEYLNALADACHEEYQAITDAGLILQMDEPEFCTSWMFHPDMSVEEYRSFLGQRVEVLNYALRGLPEEQIRFHTCWGSGHRPHVNDIELRHIADLLVRINAVQYSIEAANVRHEHEYHVWEDVRLPEGKMLMPGVISHATDLVEHPELVAERIINYAGIVGRENVQTGTDCGMGSRVGHEEIVWAKLAAMAEGAAIASRRLWRERAID